jgi:carboxyl-terminal processing protease
MPVIPAARSHSRLVPTLLALAPLAAAVWPLAAADPKPFPDMGPKVGEILDSDYYDRARVQPRLMIERGLRQLARAEPGILARWEAGTITLTLGTEQKTVAAPEPSDLDGTMAILERVRLILEDGRYKRDRARELSYELFNGALAVLDPHTDVTPPDFAQMFREDMAGEFFGIGAFLHSDEGLITVERVIPGTPAERAGVEDGDVILAINGEKTAGMLQDQAVKRIRGPKGTPVVLTVERKGVAQPLDIPVVRDLVHSISLRSWRSGDVAYIRLDEFHARANQDLCSAYLDLQRSGPIKALVIDLRFNGGGLLDQAKAICGLFLDDNAEIVRTVTVDGRPMIFKSPRRALIDVPVVCLVSPGTASAAEIVSGALQRNDRAVVIGRTTFGKGTVQTLRDLDDDSRLHFTIQEYQLPGGVSIQDVGVTPDVRLIQHSVREDGRIDLLPLTFQRESDSEFALANRSVYQHKTSYELGWLARFVNKDEQKRESIASRDFTPNQEGRLVVELVKQLADQPDFAETSVKAVREHRLRPWLLDQLKAPVAARAEIEAAALAEALKKQPKSIAWGGATAVDPATIGLSYSGPSEVAAGTTAALTFAIANRGTADVGRLFGVVRTDKASPLWEKEVVVGAIAAGQTATGTLDFAVPPRAFTGDERFTLDLFQDGRKDPVASLPVRLAVRGQTRPHLGVAWKIEEPDASRDNKLDLDEAAKLVLTIENTGDAPTAELDVRVFKDNERFVELTKTRDKLPVLAAHEKRVVEVPIVVHRDITIGGKAVPFSGDGVKLQMVAAEHFDDEVDGRFRAVLSHAITIPVGTPLIAKRVVPPSLSLVGDPERSGGNRVTLRVKVEDEALRFVGCFLGDDKIDLRPASALHDGIYTATATLKPGLNTVTVFAVDQEDTDQSLPLRLWGEGEVTLGAKPTAQVATGGGEVP